MVCPVTFRLDVEHIVQHTTIQIKESWWCFISFHLYIKTLWNDLPDEDFDRLKNCLDDVKKWLSANKLKLNPYKTEFIL